MGQKQAFKFQHLNLMTILDVFWKFTISEDLNVS